MFAYLPIALAVLTSGCTEIESDKITGRDLARADSSFTALAPDTFISYAPSPGKQRTFTIAELLAIAAKAGVADTAPQRELCFEWAMESLDPKKIVAMLQDQVQDATVELIELSRFPVPQGILEFPKSGLQTAAVGPSLWRGSVIYGDARKFPVWARVNVLRSVTRVIAREAIRPGEAIQRNQIELTETLESVQNAKHASRLEDVEGRVLRSSLAAGAPVPLSGLELPIEIDRGDLVTVKVRSGAAVLTFQAKAVSSARRGEAVQLRNESSGKMFSATAKERGLATLEVKQ